MGNLNFKIGFGPWKAKKFFQLSQYIYGLIHLFDLKKEKKKKAKHFVFPSFIDSFFASFQCKYNPREDGLKGIDGETMRHISLYCKVFFFFFPFSYIYIKI